MAVTSYTNVTRADLQILATLANSKLSPAIPYVFTPFAGGDIIKQPQDISPVAAYGTGFFVAGGRITLWLFGYKISGGVKTYNWLPVVKAFYASATMGSFSMTWTWPAATGATAPDGYVVVIPFEVLYKWQDIGLVQTFTEDGSFTNPAWNTDNTLDANNIGFPEQNMPCGHGTWLKTLNQIHNDLFTKMDIFGGSEITFNDTFLLSGPWIVSVAPKCYLKLNGHDIYKNLEFIYSTADSPTGNQLAPETDFLDFFFTPVNGTNNLTYNVNGTLNGRIIIYSPPADQAATDWTVTTSPSTGVVYTFIPEATHPINPAPMSAFQFDFTEVPIVSGTPIVLTLTPLHGGTVLSFQGGLSNVVLTQATQTITPQIDTVVIHTSGTAAKSVVIPNTLSDVSFTDPNGGTTSFETHWLVFCNGVFKANTLPTLGVFPYVDVDLPQYSPDILDTDASSRRVAIGDFALPYVASVENRGALWPVFRDTDFAPDATTGFPMNGSTAWQLLRTKYVQRRSVTITVPPYEPLEHLFIVGSVAMLAGAYDVRFYLNNPACTIYIRGNAFPTRVDFDATASGGTWVSLLASVPVFNTDDTNWFIGVYNPTASGISVTVDSQVITDGIAPNGTFFPTQLDDLQQPFPNLEGYSYHFQDPDNVGVNPIPLYGYCVYSLTIARQPVDNGSGVSLSPSTGTSALAVSVGLMAGFGFDTAGAYQELQSFTIPAGQASITASVFWPVTWGAPLAYQCAEQVQIRAAVNFQPIVHCAFFPETTPSGGGNPVIGYYDGEPFYNPNRALLFFRGNIVSDPITLPLAAVNYNDLQAALNLLP